MQRWSQFVNQVKVAYAFTLGPVVSMGLRLALHPLDNLFLAVRCILQCPTGRSTDLADSS